MPFPRCLARARNLGTAPTTPFAFAVPITPDVVNQAPRKHGCTIARMDANSNIALAMPSLELSLADVSDHEVLARTRRLVGRSNLLLAELLAHLAEVEARGIHRTRACS